MKHSFFLTSLVPALLVLPAAQAGFLAPTMPVLGGGTASAPSLTQRSNSVYSVLEAAATGDVAAMEARLAEGANPSEVDELGNSPLHYAAQGASPRAMELLLRAGADPSLRDAQGHTPRELCRHAALLKPLLEAEKARLPELELCEMVAKGDEAGVRAVLARGVNPNARSLDNAGPILLHAVTLGKPAVVRALLEAGADVNASTWQGKLTALHLAATKGDAETLRALLEAKADPMQVSANGAYPLHDAIWAQKLEAVRALLPAYAAVNFNPKGGPHGSPLAMAICYGREAYVRAFLEAGFNPNVASPGVVPALILAVRSGKPCCVKLLLAAGADVQLKDKGGKTAADYATAELAPLLH